MRPVCVKCQCEMYPKKNDVAVEYVVKMPPDKPHSYQLYLADLWQCPSCNMEIISGFGRGPISEHWQDDYSEKRAQCEKRGVLFTCAV